MYKHIKVYQGRIGMPRSINGQKYYRTAEVCKMVGVSRNTLFSLAEKLVFRDAERRDSRGWRLFTEADVLTMKGHVDRINLVRRQGERQHSDR
jgi:hypothetical protein